MCFGRKKRKNERAKKNHYSASAIDRRIKPLRDYAKKQTSLKKAETTIRLVYPLLDVFGWESENVESQFSVGESRKRADIALLKDGEAVAVVNVLKFGDDLNNQDAIKNLTEDALGCNVHLAILTNGGTYWFYSVNTEKQELDRFLEFKISRTELQNKNKPLVDFFVCEQFKAYSLFNAYKSI